MTELAQLLLDLDGAVEAVTEDKALQENMRLFGRYGREAGVEGLRPGNPHKLSRRKWIERHVRIKDKDGQIVPLVPNAAQRKLEARILRLERRGVPVRIIILKGRQKGCSTWILACMFWFVCTQAHAKTKVMADTEDKSAGLLLKIQLMLSKLSYEDGRPWKIKLRNNKTSLIAFEEPICSRIEITSAEGKNPGHSETNDFVHMTETSRWNETKTQAEGLLQTLPMRPGTYGFDETTAHGDQGYFRDEFMRAWNRQQGIVMENTASEEIASGAGWFAEFYPWFIHQDYRWTWIHKGQDFPERVKKAIESSLTEEEIILLAQKYLLRGKGWVNVDFDQLAWRRFWISEQMAGDVARFHEQYPSFVHEAFLASGSPVFDVAALRKRLETESTAPTSKCDLYDQEGDPLSEHPKSLTQAHIVTGKSISKMRGY